MPSFSKTATDWESRQRRSRFSLENTEFFSIRRIKFSSSGMKSLLTTCRRFFFLAAEKVRLLCCGEFDVILSEKMRFVWGFVFEN